MQRYKLTTRLFSEACSALEGVELDLFPWLRFFPNKTFKKLTKAQEMLDQLIDQEMEICLVSNIFNIWTKYFLYVSHESETYLRQLSMLGLHHGLVKHLDLECDTANPTVCQ